MQIVLTDNPGDSSSLVAREVLDRLREKPDLVLGLATGSTPIQVYRRLAEAHAREEADFSRVHTFNLDEYLDLPADHHQSYRRFMNFHLFDHVNVPHKNIHFPPSEGADLIGRCKAYEATIHELGGIDIQILGIGSNGHIGFNEPTSSLRSRTRIKTLTPKTLRDNARFYSEDENQPALAVTMGIGTILDTHRILLQAFGTKKAEAIRTTVEGPVSSLVPGSALQLHSDVTLYLDPDAASLLSLRDYYEDAQRREAELREAGRLS